MADKQEQGPSSGSSLTKGKDYAPQTPTEEFPPFSLSRQSSTTHKPKSLSQSDMVRKALLDQDLTSAVDRLKQEAPPLSLDQARERRVNEMESAKEQRKASINLIRSRTASRTSTTVRPNIEDIAPSG